MSELRSIGQILSPDVLDEDRLRALMDAAAVRATERQAEEAERAPALAAAAAEKRLRELVKRADERGVPRKSSIRRVALGLSTRDEQAILAIKRAVAWNTERADPRIGSMGDGLFVFLSGDVGTGKTAALAWRVTQSEEDALLVPATTMFTTLRTGHSSTQERWERWEAVPVLAIDEIGATGGSAEALQNVQGLFAKRSTDGLETYVAGNIAVSCGGACAACFGCRFMTRALADRLTEQTRDGLPWPIVLAGPSMRGGNT
jgi:hypothetical protein